MKSLFRERVLLDRNFGFDFQCQYCCNEFKTNLVADVLDYNTKTFFACPYCDMITIRIYKGHNYKINSGGIVYMTALKIER